MSLVASNLSAVARARTQEAEARRDELGRLFDLSRDILLITESHAANASLAGFISRRFDLDYVAICIPQGPEWLVFEAGPQRATPDPQELSAAFRRIDEGQFQSAGSRPVRFAPLRLGARPIGLLAAAGRPIDSATFDAVAGLAAIAIERAQFLDDRKAADLARQSEALKSALLASLGHDLRTPLTAIRVAASNLQASWPDERERHEQSDLILTEVDLLTRLFQNILEMARIDAGAVTEEMRWVAPSEIVEAARSRVEHALRGRAVEISVEPERLVRLDPRLTAAALSHLLENAAQYSPAGSAITRAHGRGGRGFDDRRTRPRSRHSRARSAARVRALPSRRQREGPAVGHRHGPRDREGDAGGGAWSDLRRELSRRRGAIHDRRTRGGEMSATARILLVDDDVSIQRVVAPLLRSRGYHVDVISTGVEAVKAVEDNAPDLIVLDLGLPDLEGAEVCRRMRTRTKAPIVILSARSGEAEKVAALDIGADDYVTKPFGPEELLARIRVALRRVLEADAPEVERVLVGDITIDFARHRVVRGDEELRLTPKEFDLLTLLARNADRVLTHRAILKAIWGPNAVDQPEHLWVLMAQLRKKIEPDPGTPRYLLSEPWVGYRLVSHPD